MSNPLGYKQTKTRSICEYLTAVHSRAISFSTTRDPGLAKTFAELRHSDGRDRRGRMPTGATGVSCKLVYKFDKDTRDGVTFRAKEMEDKWDIDLFDDRLYFSRSWTGDLVLVADVHRDRNALTVSRVNASVANPEQC